MVRDSVNLLKFLPARADCSDPCHYMLGPDNSVNTVEYKGTIVKV